MLLAPCLSLLVPDRVNLPLELGYAGWLRYSLPDLVKDGYYFTTEKTAGLSGKSGYEGL